MSKFGEYVTNGMTKYWVGRRKLIAHFARVAKIKAYQDRIAELETEVEQWKCNSRENKIIAEQAERRNAELTKQRDGLLDGLDDALKMIPCGTFDDYHLRLMATDRHLSAKAILRYRELISGIRRGAAHKNGGAE